MPFHITRTWLSSKNHDSHSKGYADIVAGRNGPPSRHAEELQRSPAEWMPWNYRETLARLATPEAA